MILVHVEVVKNIKNVVVNNEEVLSYFYTDHFDSDYEINIDRKSTRLNSSHASKSRMPSSA